MIDTSMKPNVVSPLPDASAEPKRLKEIPRDRQVAPSVPDTTATVNEPIRAMDKGAGMQNHDDRKEQADMGSMQRLADMANENINRFSRDIEFTVDRETDKVIIKVIDRESKQLIRQVPPEQLLKLTEKMEEIQGLIFSDEV